MTLSSTATGDHTVHSWVTAWLQKAVRDEGPAGPQQLGFGCRHQPTLMSRDSVPPGAKA